MIGVTVDCSSCCRCVGVVVVAVAFVTVVIWLLLVAVGCCWLLL